MFTKLLTLKNPFARHLLVTESSHFLTTTFSVVRRRSDICPQTIRFYGCRKKIVEIIFYVQD